MRANGEHSQVSGTGNPAQGGREWDPSLPWGCTGGKSAGDFLREMAEGWWRLVPTGTWVCAVVRCSMAALPRCFSWLGLCRQMDGQGCEARGRAGQQTGGGGLWPPQPNVVTGSGFESQSKQWSIDTMSLPFMSLKTWEQNGMKTWGGNWGWCFTLAWQYFLFSACKWDRAKLLKLF